MPRSIVIYTSKRGSTKQYAEWIGEALEAPVMTLDEAKNVNLLDYDVIIYGGWLRGSGIVGFDKFKKMIDQIENRVILYVTGMSEYNPENYMQICEINFKKMEDAAQIQMFFCPGRYDVDKVKGLDKLMMKVARSVLKGGKTPDGASAAEEMINMIDNGCDKVNISYIEPVVKAARKRLNAAEQDKMTAV